MSSVRICILLIVCLVGLIETRNTSFVINSREKYNILAAFNHAGMSHFKVFQPLLIELARRGHNVTVLSHYPRNEESKKREPLPNYRDLSLVDKRINIFLNVIELGSIDTSPLFSLVDNLFVIQDMAKRCCEVGLSHPRVLELIRSQEKFDVLLTENFNTDCFLPFAHRFDVPYIGLLSHQIVPWVSDRLNDPDNPSYIPHMLTGLRSPLSFFERLWNAVSLFGVKLYYESVIQAQDRKIAVKAFGPFPPFREIAKRQAATLVNVLGVTHEPRPRAPNVIDVGGLHIPSRTNPLPEDIARFLDSATEGVLYFNLGSMIRTSSMKKEMYEMFLRVIESLPRKVLWKWEEDRRPDIPNNLLQKKWLPQFDILHHPNVKCYFGHGGQLGFSEALYAGVPMILMPLYGDQFYNTAQAEKRNIALAINYNHINENIIKHAIDECFNNTRYRENVKKLSKAFRDRPASPLETAVWWTEYVARGNGAKYLRNEVVDMPWYQYLLLDVVLFLIVVSLLVFYLLYRAILLLPKLLNVFIFKKTNSSLVANSATSKKKD